MGKFEGFLPELETFFIGLAMNNNKPWFEENRAVYERAVREPLLAMIADLTPTVLEIDPMIDVRPHRVMARIHRDTRFSKNKGPYHDHLWFAFHRLVESRSEAPCLYFGISATGAHWGCGFYLVSKGALEQWRDLCRNTPSVVLEIVQEPAFAERFTVVGGDYKRIAIPETVPEPLRDLYKKKDLYTQQSSADYSLLGSPELSSVIADDFRRIASFFRLLQALHESEEGVSRGLDDAQKRD